MREEDKFSFEFEDEKRKETLGESLKSITLRSNQVMLGNQVEG